ncbi:MAG TPA: restriction endonuclease subunit S, partial [Pyrinomonadaceae bacterium]
GKVARLKGAETAYLNQRVARIKARKGEAFDDFIYAIVSQPHFDSLIAGASAGSAQANVSAVGIGSVQTPSLPEAIQLVIGAVARAFDDRIALLRETNITLEAIVQAIFKSWFVDFDPVRAKMEGSAPEGMDEETAALFPNEFEESTLGLVPRTWAIGKLGDVAQTVRTKVQPSGLNEGVNYVGLEHIPRKSIALTDWSEASGVESVKTAFNEGDILFGKLRPYFHKVVIAPMTGVCSTDILVCRAIEPNYYGFVVMHLFSEALISYADRLSNGAKMPRVNWKDLAAYDVIIPPVKIAAAFTKILGPLAESIEANIHRARTLAKLRDTLLPRLISGQLRLPEAEALTEESCA